MDDRCITVVESVDVNDDAVTNVTGEKAEDLEEEEQKDDIVGVVDLVSCDNVIDDDAPVNQESSGENVEPQSENTDSQSCSGKVNSVSEVEMKKEDLTEYMNGSLKLKRFTAKEDTFLREGVTKYGKKWAVILKDQAFKFHPCRTRDTLRVRADTLGLTRNKKRSRRGEAIV